MNITSMDVVFSGAAIGWNNLARQLKWLVDTYVYLEAKTEYSTLNSSTN